MVKSTSLSRGIPGNSSRNSFGNSLTTGIFSTSTLPLLESSIKAKNASYPFLINLLAYMDEITLDITLDLIPCIITSDLSEHLNTTVFCPQSTMARCLVNPSIPRIKSNSQNGKVIKSARNSLSCITMGQFLYTLFALTLRPNGLVICMSYANFSIVGTLSNTCSIHTYE